MPENDYRIENFKHEPHVIPGATEDSAGVMTTAQAAAVNQLVAAGAPQAFLDLLSAAAQSPTPFADEEQTVDDTPLDIELLSVADDPSTMLSVTVDVSAYDEGETQFFDAQLRASYKPGAGLGEFEQYSASTPLYGPEVDGAPAWTAELTQVGGSTLPTLRVVGAAATTVIWKVYAAIRSMP